MKGKPVTSEMLNQLEESLVRAHTLISMMFSTDPEKEKILKGMHELMNEVMELYGDFKERVKIMSEV